jgi:hypothetical protein
LHGQLTVSERELARLSRNLQGILTVELSAGQMVEDVRLAVEGRCPVAFHGRMGGLVPTPDEVLGALKALKGKVVRAHEAELREHEPIATLHEPGPHEPAPHAGSHRLSGATERIGTHVSRHHGGRR